MKGLKSLTLVLSMLPAVGGVLTDSASANQPTSYKRYKVDDKNGDKYFNKQAVKNLCENGTSSEYSLAITGATVFLSLTKGKAIVDLVCRTLHDIQTLDQTDPLTGLKKIDNTPATDRMDLLLDTVKQFTTKDAHNPDSGKEPSALLKSMKGRIAPQLYTVLEHEGFGAHEITMMAGTFALLGVQLNADDQQLLKDVINDNPGIQLNADTIANLLSGKVAPFTHDNLKQMLKAQQAVQHQPKPAPAPAQAAPAPQPEATQKTPEPAPQTQPSPEIPSFNTTTKTPPPQAEPEAPQEKLPPINDSQNAHQTDVWGWEKNTTIHGR